MHPNTLLRLLPAFAGATALLGQTAPAPKAPDVPVALDRFVVQSVAAPVANHLAGREQIALQPAAASVINVIKFLPGVSLSQGDAIGGDDWSTRINIRGFTEGQLGFSFDGVTTGYTAYGGGAKPNRYVDVENLATVVVSQGAAEISSASAQALGGTLAYASAAPLDQAGVQARLTGGSFGLQRGFVRVDTGKLEGGLRGYVSLSNLQYDNWVRDYVGGDAALSKRIHADAKATADLGQTKLTFWASLDNVAPEINFQGVSRRQFAQSPRDDRLTFTFTGRPNTDQNYAPTWTTIRTNSLTYLKAETRLADGLSLNVQPYWAYQNGKGQFLPPFQVRRFDLSGGPSAESNYVPANRVGTVFFADAAGRDVLPVNPATGAAAADPFNIATYTWLTPAQQAAAKPLSSARFSRYLNNRFGANAGVEYQVAAGHRLRFGLWHETQRRERYRTWHAVIDPTQSPVYNEGAYLKSFHWDYRTTNNMFYAEDQMVFGALTVNAGLKYFQIDFRGRQRLLQSDGSFYAKELDSNSKPLPSAGVVYKLDATSEFFAGFSRNFSAVKDTIFTDNVTASGTDYSRVKPEYALNLDAGYRYAGPDLAFSATAYSIRYTDKIVNLSGNVAKDYTNTGAGSVLVNVGGLDAMGAELAASYRLGGGFNLLASYSRTRAIYTENTPDGTILKDKKVVDTPDQIASLGLVYAKGGLSFGLLGKNTGRIYSTYANDGSIPAVTVYDLNLGYTRTFSGRDFIRSLGFELNVMNLLDRNYLGGISINDQGYVKSDPNGTTMLYNIGAPRTIAFSVSLGF
jgi:iron complex outermembrane receptor protein